jgi:uncharacterized protein
LNFPDANLWIALAHAVHEHHAIATQWMDSLSSDERVYFCRVTQLGLLRVLTTRAAMKEDVLTQREALAVYERLLQDDRTAFHHEPRGFDAIFHRLCSRDEASPKRWADDYLAAFALSANLTLVTFDRALAERVPSSILLTP